MEIFSKSRPWDGKKPTSDMDGDDWYKWDKWRRQKSADDGDWYLNKKKYRHPNQVRHRIWPRKEIEHVEEEENKQEGRM